MHSIKQWRTLNIQNAHPRDAHIQFDEKTHTYSIDGSYAGYISVTKLIHCFFPEFNADEIIHKMQNSSKWPENKYFGKTAYEIKEEWNNNGKSASSAGTKMHFAIEQFMNGAGGMINENMKISPEWTYFQKFWKDYGPDIEPYRTEWEVWAKDIKLAGSIDCVFRRKSDGKYIIYDWKRSKEIKTDNSFETGYSPVNHLPNSNYWHYTIQLNIYRWILETYYNLEIADMYLIILHPDNKSYCRMRLNRLENEIKDILDTRNNAVIDGCKKYVVLPTICNGISSSDTDDECDNTSFQIKF